MRLSPKSLFVVAAFVLLAAYPLVAGQFGVDLVAKIMIYAIFALSLELLVGTTGLVCFGHAALFGIGAYSAVLLSPEYDAGPLAVLLPASIAAAAVYALFMGALSLRTKGVYFIMVTLAFAQMAYYVIHDTKVGGGTDGIYLNVKPVLAVGGSTLINLDDASTFYAFTWPRCCSSSASWRCCCARASAVRWRASRPTSSACAPRASRPTRTNSPPS
jgi:branched-chain amino acid transport system permease protein